MHQRRPLVIGLAIATAAVVVVLLAGGSGGRPGGGASASPGASGIAIGDGGPVVFYEIVDADGAKLMVRTLDGRSLAHVVASRADVNDAATWSVDPTGTTAIAGTNPPAGGTRLEGVSVASGTTVWKVDLDAGRIADGVWSTDGRRFAATTDPDDPSDREVLVVDPLNGRLERTGLPDGALVQGFAPDGALILRQRRPGGPGGDAAWLFLRIDPASGLVEPLAVLPEVGPASGWSEDVDPAVGIGFDQTIAPDDETKIAIRIWSLGAGTSRILATFPTVDRVEMDPTGQLVAVAVQKSILLVRRDGRSSEIWSGFEPPTVFHWSTGGAYLSVMTDQTVPALFVVERSSGRVVELPLPAAVARAAVLRIVDDAALPAIALPAAEPTPTPTPGPSGADVAATNGVLVAWIADTAGGAILHVERRVPTTAGGMRTVAAMGTANLGPRALLDSGLNVTLLLRPGSRDVLVWVQGLDRTDLWLWDGDGPRRDVPLPVDWPAVTYDLAWRPDGLAIAASAPSPDASGEAIDGIVIARLGGRTTTVMGLPKGAYDRLEGWWSNTELRLGHAICTEGCPGRYAWSARLRIRDGRVAELRPIDRAHGVVDLISPVEPARFDMLPGNEMPEGTIHVAWPAALGSGSQFVAFAADGRALIVTAEPAEGTDVYRIADPAGRATKGRLTDPTPVRLGHLARRGIDVRVSPDERWALVMDRTGGIELVELATGHAWPIDRDTTTIFSPTP